MWSNWLIFFCRNPAAPSIKNSACFPDDVLAVLKNYSWPGNVRELKHVIERLVITAKGSSLTLKDLPKEIREAKTAPRAGQTGSQPQRGGA